MRARLGVPGPWRQTVSCAPVSEKQQDSIPQHAPFVAAIRYGGTGLVAVAVIASIVSYLMAGSQGLWGALIGAALGGAFILATVLTMYLMRNSSPTTTGAVLLGSWLVKLIIAIAVMVILRDMDFYNKYALVFTVVAALFVCLTAETMAIMKTNIPYVSPEPSETTDND